VELPQQFDDLDEQGPWRLMNSSALLTDGATRFGDMPRLSISHLIAFGHLSTILGTILTQVYSVKRKRSYKEDHECGLLQDLSSRLQQWHVHLNPYLRWVSGENNRMLPHVCVIPLPPVVVCSNECCRYILNLWFWVCVILLHRPYIPFSSAVLWQDDQASPHWICTYAADRICDLVAEYQQRFGLRFVSGNVI
jgi:hypothetical protein